MPRAGTGTEEALTPLFIGTHNALGMGRGVGTPNTSGAWGTASLAAFYPIFLPFYYTVRRMYWCNGTSPGGHNDIGIFSAGGSNIWSIGSTAGSGTSVLQFVTVSTPVTLSPGTYFMAFVADSTTSGRITTVGVGGAAVGAQGTLQMASALPLPTTATFANGGQGMPVMGMTRTASGF